MASIDEEGGAGDLPELVVTMLNAIGRYFGADETGLTLELRYGGGGFEKWYRHDSGGISALAKMAESG